MFDGQQECPHCEQIVPREHFVIEPLVGYLVTHLYCEFCQRGIETLWKMIDGRPIEEFSVNFSGARPLELGRFLQRLHDARAA